MEQELFLIYARASNGVIGKEGALPWHISTDLKRFKRLTIGKPMIMGRKTFESFPAPLPGRRHIVLTKDPKWYHKGIEIAYSVNQALALAGGGEIAIIGGAQIYALFIDLANRVELTEIDATFEGDSFMPPLDEHVWELTSRDSYQAEGETPAFSFATYRRKMS